MRAFHRRGRHCSARIALAGRHFSHRARGLQRDKNKDQQNRSHGGERMVSLVVTLLVIALIAALLGFTGIAGAAAGMAKLAFIVFLVLAVIAFLARGARSVS
jgi:uncharacterized membrane protein YtjA (UPF0391 family)